VSVKEEITNVLPIQQMLMGNRLCNAITSTVLSVEMNFLMEHYSTFTGVVKKILYPMENTRVKTVYCGRNLARGIDAMSVMDCIQSHLEEMITMMMSSSYPDQQLVQQL